MSITINYDANDIMRASLFPFIQQLPNGSKDLVWDNGGNYPTELRSITNLTLRSN